MSSISCVPPFVWSAFVSTISFSNGRPFAIVMQGTVATSSSLALSLTSAARPPLFVRLAIYSYYKMQNEWQIHETLLILYIYNYITHSEKINIKIYICIFVYLYTCIFIYTTTYIFIYLYIFIYIYIYSMILVYN